MSNAVVEQQAVWRRLLEGIRRYTRAAAVITGVETLKIIRDPAELFTRAIQPALWLLIFGQTFTRLHVLPVGGSDYLSFLAPGILAQSITFVAIFYGIAIIWERDVGVLQKYLSTPVARSALIVGKALSAGFRALVQAVIILILAALLGARLEWDPLTLLAVVITTLLGAAFFSSFSMFIASLVKTRERMMGIGQLITMPLFFASNALYPIGIMPNWLKAVASFNPMSYLVDALRSLLTTGYHGDLGLDALVLAAATAAVLSLATAFYPRLAT